MEVNVRNVSPEQLFFEAASIFDPIPTTHSFPGIGNALEVASRDEGISVRYKLRDIPGLLATPIGRNVIMRGLLLHLFPLRAAVARVYRTHWVTGTRVFAVVGSLGKSKSSLETIHAALDTLETLPTPRKWVVMGDISEPGHQGPTYKEVGRRLAQVADGVVIYGKEFARYRAGVRQVGIDHGRLVHARGDLEAAVGQIRDWLQPVDVVLVKGRDTERLDRISRLLRGDPVGCRIGFCDTQIRCDLCPMVGSGWGKHRVVL